MNNFFFFIAHMPTFLKFYYTNLRYKHAGYRKFKFKLYIEKKNKHGDSLGFSRQAKNILIIANYRDHEYMSKIPIPDYIMPADEAIFEYRRQQLPFILLRDFHAGLFQACDHLTYKEVI